MYPLDATFKFNIIERFHFSEYNTINAQLNWNKEF